LRMREHCKNAQAVVDFFAHPQGREADHSSIATAGGSIASARTAI
jgi:hypothetical protein